MIPSEYGFLQVASYSIGYRGYIRCTVDGQGRVKQTQTHPSKQDPAPAREALP